jgi:hypothetical protein
MTRQSQTRPRTASTPKKECWRWFCRSESVRLGSLGSGDRVPSAWIGAEIAQAFKGARSDRVAEILDTLVALGRAEVVADGRYIAG